MQEVGKVKFWRSFKYIKFQFRFVLGWGEVEYGYFRGNSVDIEKKFMYQIQNGFEIGKNREYRKILKRKVKN